MDMNFFNSKENELPVDGVSAEKLFSTPEGLTYK